MKGNKSLLEIFFYVQSFAKIEKTKPLALY